MHIYNNTKDINIFIQANETLDNLLTYIKPYITSEQYSAQATIEAFKSYSKTVNEHIIKLKENVVFDLKYIKENKNSSKLALDKIKKIQENIQLFENDFLIGDENKKSLKNEIQELLVEVKNIENSINIFYKKLTSGNEYESAIILQVEEAKEKIITNFHLTEGIVKSVEKLTKDLNDFYIFIFGEEKNNNLVTIEGGLNKLLDNKITELNQLKEAHDRTYNERLHQIESLLPGATSAGLATAYHGLKESFKRPVIIYSSLFYLAITIIFLLSMLMTIKQAGLYYIEFINISSPEEIFSHILYKLPLIVPIVWLALFASKRRSEYHRLLQEYAHKEAIIKSYENFKKQIEVLEPKNYVLLEKLIEAAISTVAFNASTTLDKKHGDKLPISEIIEKSIDKIVDKLKIYNCKP